MSPNIRRWSSCSRRASGQRRSTRRRTRSSRTKLSRIRFDEVRALKPAALAGRRVAGQGRQRGSEILRAAGVISEPAHERRQRRRRKHVAAIEGALPPGAMHEPVAGQNAERRGCRPNSCRKQQRRDKARQGSKVDLLLGPDLDRVPLRQQDSGEARRDQSPPPGLCRCETTISRRDRSQSKARQRDSDNDRLQPRRQAGEGWDQGLAQLVGTSRVRVKMRPPLPSAASETWYRLLDDTTWAP